MVQKARKSTIFTKDKTIEYGSLLFLLLFVNSIGCATTHKISYNMDDITKSNNPELSSYVLDIQNFYDVRKESWANVILWGDSRKIYLDKKLQCVNIEKHYDNDAVSPQITTLIAEHIKKKESFKDITTNKKESADFCVSGKLERFFGRREFSQTAQTTGMVGMQYGAVGGLISSLMIAGMKSPGETVIIFKDIVIKNREGKIIHEIGELNSTMSMDMRVDGNCWTVYGYVDEQLKATVEEFANKIESIISLYVREQKGI